MHWSSALLGRVFAGMALVAAVSAVEPEGRPRTMRIAGAWNLSAIKHERTEMDGTRVKTLTSTGRVTLKHGPNMIRGPWDVDAKADSIQCDFPGKKFILTGSPMVQRKNKAGQVIKELTGEAGTVMTITFADPVVAVTGPHTEKTFEPAAPVVPAPPAKDAPEKEASEPK